MTKAVRKHAKTMWTNKRFFFRSASFFLPSLSFRSRHTRHTEIERDRENGRVGGRGMVAKKYKLLCVCVGPIRFPICNKSFDPIILFFTLLSVFACHSIFSRRFGAVTWATNLNVAAHIVDVVSLLVFTPVVAILMLVLLLLDSCWSLARRVSWRGCSAGCLTCQTRSRARFTLISCQFF